MTRADWLRQALDIPLPKHPALALDSCRRLMGANLYSDQAGAVGEATVTDFSADRVAELWAQHVTRLLQAMVWRRVNLSIRTNAGGVNLFLPAPVDRLFTVAYVIEVAWYFCASDLLGRPTTEVSAMVADLNNIMSREANPELCATLSEAKVHGIDYMLDDETVTLGHGTGSVTLNAEDLPLRPEWSALHDIPLALVTGTNGKTTTTRLIAAMGQAAGLVSGLSSTEFVKVGDVVLDRGDYSGPAGARLLLTDKRLQLGVLEVARGGILRRGLPVRHARVAVVTNVAADHLGQYGIHTVQDLAEVKLSVHRALIPGGALVLNADDPLVVAAAPPGSRVQWFSLSSDNPKILAAQASGDTCGWYDGASLCLFDKGQILRLIEAKDVPLTLGGAARFNIENALAAALAARALGLSHDAIRDVLARFKSDAIDNPGRANEFSINGARVFVDFAHNPHSIAAITAALSEIPAKRRLMMLSHAGDRSNSDIIDLVSGAFALRPDTVVIAENPNYLRGRDLGELPRLMEQRCLELGLPADQILLAANPGAAAALVLDRVQPGDLALILVHDDREDIFAMLRERGEMA